MTIAKRSGMGWANVARMDDLIIANVSVVSGIGSGGGGGGGGPDATYAFETDAWQANGSWVGHLNTAWATSPSAQFTRSTTQSQTGSSSCAINPTGGSVNMLLTDYGSEPSELRLYFYNETAKDKIFLSYGNFDALNKAQGAWCYMDMNAPLLSTGDFEANGTLGAARDSDGTMTLTNATWYYIKVTISTAGGTTTITAGVYSTGDALQGGTVTYGYSNTNWTNNIMMGGQTSGQVKYADNLEVYN